MKRSEQKAQTRERILEHANACFRELGYPATTIAKIARRAGVASGTVMSHFPDKPTLVSAAFHEELLVCQQQALATLPDGDALERLVHLALALYRWFGEEPELGAELVRESLFLRGSSGTVTSDHVEGFLLRVVGALEPVVPASRHAELPFVAEAFFIDYFGVLTRALSLACIEGGALDLRSAEEALRALLGARLRGLDLLDGPDRAGPAPRSDAQGSIRSG